MSKKKTMKAKGADQDTARKPEGDLPVEDGAAMGVPGSGRPALADEGTGGSAAHRAAGDCPGSVAEDPNGEKRTEGLEVEENPPEGPGESDGVLGAAGEEDGAGLTPALEAALAQVEEYLNLAQRVQADFDNFRRRNQNVRSEAFDDGARAFIATLLPVVDNLERAMDAARESPDPALREGVEMVCRQLLEAFEKRGVRPINRLGERFDPNLENAVLQGGPEEGEPGVVCEVFQKGYQMGDAVLRHAMVKVVAE